MKQIKITSDMNSLFMTSGQGEFWRQLIAFNPTDRFIMRQATEVDALKEFLSRNDHRLVAGYFSYDLGMQLLNLFSRHLTSTYLAVLHAYDKWEEDTDILWPEKSSKLDLSFRPEVDKNQYSRDIKRIHNYIRAGDVYQINYTQQLRDSTSMGPRRLFPELIQRHPAAYACYFEYENTALHSLSPELFLHFEDGILVTEPIKGTRPRGDTPHEDARLRQALLDSEKEQAELSMITDLLRNDLGEVCEVGSVHLDEIRKIHKLPRVWHTSSRISGQLHRRLSACDALLSMLPGGSISGCPKKRAVEVIDELESSARGIYTGSIGYFHPAGDYSFNIAIRTLVQRGQQLSLGSGGGITIDSEWKAEWEELLVKASTFLQ